MLGDRERPGAYASEQRRLVRAAVAAEVLAYTPYWRDAAAEAGLGRPTSASDLAGLPPRPLSSLGAPNTLVLRPPPDVVRRSGPRPLRRRLRRARMRRGGAGAMRRILDPLYKPIHWIIEGEVPVGCTEADLVRLTELGRRSLELAGIGPSDAIVGLVPPGPTLSSWQLALGAREAAVPLAALAPSASIDAVTLLGPTVLAGRPPDLLRVLEGLTGPARAAMSVVLAITRAPLLEAERAALQAAAGREAAVVEWWAPPGTRALWTQCRGGDGVHTWPQAELLEVCGPDGTPVETGAAGQLVWTGLGWRGTALVRLATGLRGRLVEGSCETCGRTTPRILDARPLNGAERPRDDGEAGLGELKETGTFESVRTVRPRRSERVRGRRTARPPAEEAVPTPEVPTAAVATVAVGPGEPDRLATPVVEVAENEAEGVVRAVAKEPVSGSGASPAPAQAGPAGGGEVADLGHLAPVPEVGPDASVEQGEGGWLPDTGEVDAWPAPVLASTDGVAAWQVEHRRRRGRDELVVHLALTDEDELAEVLIALERAIGATQYVLGAEAEVAARVAAAGGSRVVDRRALGNGQGRQLQGSGAGPPRRSREG